MGGWEEKRDLGVRRSGTRSNVIKSDTNPDTVTQTREPTRQWNKNEKHTKESRSVYQGTTVEQTHVVKTGDQKDNTGRDGEIER